LFSFIFYYFGVLTRLREAEQPTNNAMFPKLGSKFRYSGRTLFQARQRSEDLDRGDPYFERSQPVRSTMAAPYSRSEEREYLSFYVAYHPVVWL
jgi:erythrocyte membrane protein band 4.1